MGETPVLLPESVLPLSPQNSTIEYLQSGIHGTQEVLAHHMIPILTYVFNTQFLLMLLYMAAQLRRRVYILQSNP